MVVFRILNFYFDILTPGLVKVATWTTTIMPCSTPATLPQSSVEFTSIFFSLAG